MRFGPNCPDGFLPVFSTDTEEEARQLLVLCCSTNLKGEFIAEELARKRDLESLQAFSDRLQRGWDFLMAAKKKKAEEPKKTAPSAMAVFEDIQSYIEDACEKLPGADYDLILEELTGYIEVCREARTEDRERG